MNHCISPKVLSTYCTNHGPGLLLFGAGPEDRGTLALSSFSSLSFNVISFSFALITRFRTSTICAMVAFLFPSKSQGTLTMYLPLGFHSAISSRVSHTELYTIDPYLRNFAKFGSSSLIAYCSIIMCK